MGRTAIFESYTLINLLKEICSNAVISGTVDIKRMEVHKLSIFPFHLKVSIVSLLRSRSPLY